MYIHTHTHTHTHICGTFLSQLVCRDAHDAPDARDALCGPRDSMGDIM